MKKSLFNFVTFSDDRFGRKNGLYAETQKKISLFLDCFFGMKHFDFKYEDLINTAFFKNHEILLSNTDAARNGRAYKPWAILTALNNLQDGEFLIYSDCSPEMWNLDNYDFLRNGKIHIDVLAGLTLQNGGLFSTFVKWDTRNIPQGGLGIHTHDNFTLNRCIDYMGMQKYRNSFMHASGIMCFQKTPAIMDFVRSWLHYNCIDECSALGLSHIPNDYSFWDAEENFKMGHRHDQSISGLLINNYGYKLCDIVHKDELNIPTHNFLNFCRVGYNYQFIDSNYNPAPERKIKKGTKVINSAGQMLTVFEIRPENGIEWLIVGLHRESCYRTTEEELTIK